jgi:hypothetical protein
MRECDREAFGVHLERLFGAFPSVPLNDARRAAYWDGLAAMSIELFERCVNRAIGQDGEERIPSASRVWEISRELRVSGGSRADARRPSTQYLLARHVLKRCALSRGQIWRPWVYLTTGNPHSGADFAVTGVIVPAADGLPAIRVMALDVDLDAVWLEAEAERVALERSQRQLVLPQLPSTAPAP